MGAGVRVPAVASAASTGHAAPWPPAGARLGVLWRERTWAGEWRPWSTLSPASGPVGRRPEPELGWAGWGWGAGPPSVGEGGPERLSRAVPARLPSRLLPAEPSGRSAHPEYRPVPSPPSFGWPARCWAALGFLREMDVQCVCVCTHVHMCPKGFIDSFCTRVSTAHMCKEGTCAQ